MTRYATIIASLTNWFNKYSLDFETIYAVDRDIKHQLQLGVIELEFDNEEHRKYNEGLSALRRFQISQSSL